MKYKEFKNKIQKYPIFSSSHLGVLTDNEQVLRNQLAGWRSQGLLLRLKKGLYVLNKEDRKINPSRPFIANQLLSPSYLSTEYALSLYGLIPERVEDVTSVTTKKTTTFRNDFGTFHYQHINIPCFVGFKETKDENGYPFFIAEPEKAVVDFLYLNLSNFSGDVVNIFRDSYRFQNVSSLGRQKIKKLAEVFHNKKLLNVARSFCEFMESG
ncbi:hypothetical protein MUO65_02670 [bacterium]|nr:hypothetical protein [bacterium]